MTVGSSQKRNGRPPSRGATVFVGVDGRQTINQTKLAILITFLSILVKGKIHYCEPRPDTIIELLAKYHNITIGRRWFFQCTNDLETIGFIRRKRRKRYTDENKVFSDPSLWSFTLRGARFLSSKLIRGAKELVRSIIDWLHRDDDRFPTPKDLGDIGSPTTREEALKRLKDLIKDIG